MAFNCKPGRLYRLDKHRWLLPKFDRALEPHYDWRKVKNVLYVGRVPDTSELHTVIVDGLPLQVRTRMLDFFSEYPSDNEEQ